MKKIFIGQVSKYSHAVDKQLMKFPPKGYEVIIPQTTLKYGLLCYLSQSSLLKKIYRAIIKPFFRGETYAAYSYLYSTKIPEEADIILSNGPVDQDIPYILNIIDSPFGITGHNYPLFMKSLKDMNKSLSSENCKAIVVPFKDCYGLCQKYFNEEVHKKIIQIHFGVNPQKYRKRECKKIRFLFIGSLANPHDFEVKGGIESLEAFSKLHKEYGGRAELIIRCKIPDWIKQKYSFEGVRIIEKTLSEKELEELYLSSHVFLTFAHIFVATTPLEAMSFGLPLIGLDVYGVNEYLKNNTNGFLIKPSSKNSYNDLKYITIIRSDSFLENIRNPDQRVINDICNALKRFVENPQLAEKMGKNSLNLIKKEFSLKKRNEELKRLFDRIN